MKNPKQFPWKLRLPEHLPNKDLWQKISKDKSLECQVNRLKSQLPVFQPKIDLWDSIEKETHKRKVIFLWYKIAAAAAIIIIGVWSSASLLTKPVEIETSFPLTTVSEDFDKTIPQTLENILPKSEEKPLFKTDIPKNNPAPPIDRSNQRPEIEPIHTIPPRSESLVKIQEPEILNIGVDGIHSNPTEIKNTSIGSKRTITVTWEEQPRSIKIDGFIVNLTEREIQIIQELEGRKKGKFKLDTNSLSARLYAE